MLLWLQRGLELLWLLAIFLVPLAFLRISESPLPLPSAMETAKIAIFRSLVGLMAVLWLVEWGLKGHLPFSSADGYQNNLLKRWLSSFKGWLSEQFTRWIIVAVMFYLAVVLLGTLLSQSFGVSLWGRIPGTDNTATYTAVCNVLLFGVIVAHLKTRAQLWRLLTAITGVGALVAGYAVLQYFGQDFLGLLASGGRASSTLGNPIFTASFLLIIFPISLAFAVTTLTDPVRSVRFWQKAGLWSLVLALQLAGIVFTFSRGPWGGTAVALAVFLVMAAVFAGRGALGRVGLVLGMVPGLFVIVVLAAVAMGLYQPDFGDTLALEQIEGRITTLRTEGTSGAVTERLGIWTASGQIITERPWFEFEESSLALLRPIIGYGPDLFTAVFMLGSDPVGPRQIPFETTHAHNYFIHYWVELGVLGLVASLGIFVLPAVVAGWALLRNKGNIPFFQKVMIIGLLSVLAGRFVEQMVGVAKVSDSMLFWVVLALLVCLPALTSSGVAPSSESTRVPPTRGSRRRDRGGAAVTVPFPDTGIYWRSAVVVLLVGGIVALTWVENINNLLALNQVAGLNQAFTKGDLNASVMNLNRAIELAPDVYHYRSNLGEVYSEYRSTTVPEPECALRSVDSTEYDICLAQKVFDSYFDAVARSRWRWQSRLDLADAQLDLFRLTQDGEAAAEAVRLYRETAAMVPQSWQLRYHLARTLIAVDDPEAALLEIDRSLSITGDGPNSLDALLLRGPAYNHIGNAYAQAGQYQRAVESYDEAIRNNPKYALAYNNRGVAYVQLRQYESAIADYSQAIRLNPKYTNAYFYRALANARSDLFVAARNDMEQAVELGADRATLENAINEMESGAAGVQSDEQ